MILEKILLYRPLAVALGIAVIMAAALNAGSAMPFMNGLMGVFLCLLAMLQMIGLKGFARLFAQYDPLAKRFRPYAFLYPFIELALGCLYLHGGLPFLANVFLLAVLGINTAGVARVLRTGQAVQCGCAGAAFNLPVGRVTLAENIAMMAMALWMLLA